MGPPATEEVILVLNTIVLSLVMFEMPFPIYPQFMNWIEDDQGE